MGWGEGNNNVVDSYQGPIMERCGGFLYIYIYICVWGGGWGVGGVCVCVIGNIGRLDCLKTIKIDMLMHCDS